MKIINVNCILCAVALALCAAIVVTMRILWLSSAASVYLFMVAFVWVASSFLWWCFGKKQYGGRGLYVLNFILLYALLVFSSYAYGWFLDYKLNQFDLDNDFIFSAAEQTPEQQRYMKLVINDAGRNLIFVLGAFYSFFSTVVLFVFVKLYGLFLK